MKKFVFSLQAVYDINISAEKQQRMLLEQINAKLNELENEQNRQQQVFGDCKAKEQSEIKRGISSNKLAQYTKYLETLRANINEIKKLIVIAKREKQKCLNELVQIKRKVKTLEKLREKQYQEYLAEMRKQEQMQTEDFVSFQTASR